MPDNAGSPRFDLQAHSTHSDGELPPREVVAEAARAGVELMALTDHDSVAGVEEAQLSGREHGVRVLAATELSTRHGEREDLHVLGYGIDTSSPQLVDELARFRQQRAQRGDDMAQRLRDLGFHVDDRVLAERRSAGKSIGRPHLAEAVLAEPRNAERLARERIPDVSAFIASYLIAGTPGFVPRPFPTVAEAIELIHRAGGAAVWAHPFWDVPDAPDVLELATGFVADGLDGVEAFYPTHDAEQTRLLAGFCEDRDLLATGSSDFHGPGHGLFARFLAFETYGLQARLPAA